MKLDQDIWLSQSELVQGDEMLFNGTEIYLLAAHIIRVL
jgi:hypothetical protein